jgi:hypothetical protein
MTKTLTVSNIGKFETGAPPAGWGVRRTISDLFRISCFEFRASNFGFNYLVDLSDALDYD